MTILLPCGDIRANDKWPCPEYSYDPLTLENDMIFYQIIFLTWTRLELTKLIVNNEIALFIAI